uniref:Ycf13 n=1 Tax=Cryptoglena skujai TaxID=161229 RepID=A0A0G3SFD1_9EUGL|nr:ycf13 [Cryptoglena skujai]AKL38994.1 ycf13 [Cryptoglena skujai]
MRFVMFFVNFSWQKYFKNIFRLQKRLFKIGFFNDIKKCLMFQRLILRSNSARILSIRYVTQISMDKKFAGIDGKVSLSFNDRFELNEYLRCNFNNWQPQSLKKVSFIEKNGIIKSLKLSTIADRAWQYLILFSIEPVHEATFNICNFGFRRSRFIHELQRVLILNLEKQSLGFQKRILIVNFKGISNFLNKNLLVKNIVAPRGIKIGIFKSLTLGLSLFFDSSNQNVFNLSSFLLNVALGGVDNIHYSLRFGYNILFILKPLDNEKLILKKLESFFINSGMQGISYSVFFSSTLNGFDFLGWYFKVFKNGDFICVPSNNNYQNFLKRIKLILNNSNYGATVKSAKIFPLTKDWKMYHRFCNLTASRFSLFFLKKRAFKVFNQESKQDSYSTKRLINKCFYELNPNNKNMADFGIMKSPFYGHLTFWVNSFYFNPLSSLNYRSIFFCIHCGMRF